MINELIQLAQSTWFPFVAFPAVGAIITAIGLLGERLGRNNEKVNT